jgi:hypothetical protein
MNPHLFSRTAPGIASKLKLGFPERFRSLGNIPYDATRLSHSFCEFISDTFFTLHFRSIAKVERAVLTTAGEVLEAETSMSAAPYEIIVWVTVHQLHYI